MTAEKAICLVTPTWGGDLHHFRMLRRSLISYGLGDVPHYVVVHTEDRAEFRPFEQGGVRLLTTADVLPADIEKNRLVCARRNAGDGSYKAKLYRSLRKRISLFRWSGYFGWQVQQITKLYLPLALDQEITVLLDSDLILCSPLNTTEFITDGCAQLLDNHTVVTQEQDRHASRWMASAHHLLGTTYHPLAPQNYRSDTPVVFDRTVIRALHDEIERRYGAPVHEVLMNLKPMSWSEFMLYNAFAERFVNTRLRRRFTNDSLQEQCIDPEADRANVAELIRTAFESPDIRFLRIISRSRDRLGRTGAEFAQYLDLYLAPAPA